MRHPWDRISGCLGLLKTNGFVPETALDIGAHASHWSRHLKAVFPDCSIALAEPLVELCPHLVAFCEEFPGCRYIPFAIGDRAEVRELTVNRDQLPASSFTISSETANARGWPRRPIQVVTVDDMLELAGFDSVDLVKIDAEGYELRILESSAAVWRSRPLFFVEVCFLPTPNGTNGFSEVTSFFDKKGYCLFDFTWFMRAEATQNLFLAEALFIPRDHPLRQWR